MSEIEQKNKISEEEKKYIVKLFKLDTIFLSMLYVAVLLFMLFFTIAVFIGAVKITSRRDHNIIITTIVVIICLPIIISKFIKRLKVFKLPFEKRFEHIQKNKLVIVAKYPKQTINALWIAMICFFCLAGVFVYAGLIMEYLAGKIFFFTIAGLFIVSTPYLWYRYIKTPPEF